MNELPKSARDELARQQRSAVEHPDADLLTAFVDGAAKPAERARVEQHLALCGQCREVMFLATPPQEASSKAVALKPQRRMRWFPVWVPWAAAATILFAATWTLTNRKTEKMALYSKVEQDKTRTAATPQTPAASTQPPAAAPEASASAPKPARQSSGGNVASLDATEPTKGKEAEHAARVRRDEDVEAKKDSAANGTVGGLVANEAMQTSTLAKAESAPAAVPPPPPPAAPADRVAVASRNTSLKPGPAAPVQNQMAQNQVAQAQAAETVEAQSEAAQNSPRRAGGTSMKTMARAMAPPKSHWRITAAGALERQVANSGWTPVALAAGTHFTVVASVGNTVWAGNDVGGLYRSDDGGANWTSAALPGLANGPGSRITAIEFSDSLSGEVSTADGSRWSTSDGGRSWQHN